MPPRESRRKQVWIYTLGLVLTALGLIGVASSSPVVCRSCHAMRPFVEAHSKSSHASAHCYSCHASAGTGGVLGFKLSEVTRMWVPGLLGTAVSGPATTLERTACLACHADELSRQPAGGLRISHVTCAADGTCDTCHSAIVHKDATRFVSEPVMEDCVACHRQENAPTACDTCHAEKSAAERLATSPWAVTHGPRWEQTHGMGDLRSCNMCHEDSKCAGCHGIALPHPVEFGSTHPGVALSVPDSCTQCHDVSALCDACHGTRMPHPDDFLAKHPESTSTLDEPMCQKCHEVADCQRCHTAHTHPGRTDGTLGFALPGGGSQ